MIQPLFVIFIILSHTFLGEVMFQPLFVLPTSPSSPKWMALSGGLFPPLLYIYIPKPIPPPEGGGYFFPIYWVKSTNYSLRDHHSTHNCGICSVWTSFIFPIYIHYTISWEKRIDKQGIFVPRYCTVLYQVEKGSIAGLN